jgi:hypothetical protein
MAKGSSSAAGSRPAQARVHRVEAPAAGGRALGLEKAPVTQAAGQAPPAALQEETAAMGSLDKRMLLPTRGNN